MEIVGFQFKKIVSLLIYPLGISLMLSLAGMLVWIKRIQSRWGMTLVSIGMIVLLVSSMPLTARLLLEPLEGRAGGYCNPRELKEKGVKQIVVLSSDVVRNDMSLADRWGGTSLRSLLEGVRLSKALPETRLVLSGGSLTYINSQPAAMAELPVLLGVPPEMLVIKTGALDTADEAVMFRDMVGTEPFALVTSATHMTRAIRLFRKQGANPIACPCNFTRWRDCPWYLWYTLVLPDAYSLLETTVAIHEYMGDLWMSIRKL